MDYKNIMALQSGLKKPPLILKGFFLGKSPCNKESMA
jgi:hypothetical protein